MSADASTSRLVRWEILEGLPGDGPAPKYFHLGHPTPWAEGFVVRFWNADGTNWVGRFQGLQDWSTKVLLWPEADSVAVLAMDNFYLVDAGNPASYVTLDSSPLVDDVMLDYEHELLFVAESTAVYAFGRDRRLRWSQRNLNGYDAQLESSADGVVNVDVEEELGGRRRIVRLSAKDGTIL